MNSHQRLDKAYAEAIKIPFDNESKFILFSDCHRGDNSFADDFARNENIYFHAVQDYFEKGYTYIELGDGDELWENRNFSTLLNAHKNVYKLLVKFHNAGRLHLIWGNHDMVYRKPAYVKKHLSQYFEPITNSTLPLFKNLRYHEGVVLKHKITGQQLFLCHGHQADWMNYHGWKFNRFLVRVLWRPLQIFGISDPTSPAKNYRELKKVERRIKKWIEKNKKIITITGHTHRPRFPKPKDIPFFNDGSCVHPRSITGLEIENNQITLVKWHISIVENGNLSVQKVILEGPCNLSDYT